MKRKRGRPYPPITTPEIRNHMRRLYATGRYSHREIGEMVGVGTSAAQRVCSTPTEAE